jgi:hypothetical protein
LINKIKLGSTTCSFCGRIVKASGQLVLITPTTLAELTDATLEIRNCCFKDARQDCFIYPLEYKKKSNQAILLFLITQETASTT